MRGRGKKSGRQFAQNLAVAVGKIRGLSGSIAESMLYADVVAKDALL